MDVAKFDVPDEGNPSVLRVRVVDNKTGGD